MSRPVIVVGDKTSHGGVVIQGSPVTDTHGKMIARVGDAVSCPKRGCPRTVVIATGDPTFVIDDRPVARHGDSTSCGATLLSSQAVTYVDAGSTGAGLRGAAAGAAGGGAAASPVRRPGSAEREDYDQHFALLDGVTGKPLAGRLYKITWSGGIAEGRSDAAGLTQKIAASAPTDATIEVFAEGH